MQPLFALTLATMGAAALLRWYVKEVHRVNAELDHVRATSAAEPIDRSTLPKLRRDPETGEYRPG